MIRLRFDGVPLGTALRAVERFVSMQDILLVQDRVAELVCCGKVLGFQWELF